MRSSNEIKWKCWTFFSKGRIKCYDCFAIEVRLKNCTLWGYRSTYPYSQRKGVSPAPGICPTSPHWIFVAKILLGSFQCDDFFKEISKLPTETKIWLSWQFPLPLCYGDIYDDTSAKPCMCFKAINKLAVTILSGKKASKYKSEGNFSHIKKLLMACEILAW